MSDATVDKKNTLSAEQNKFVFARDLNIVGLAYAGTGKTTTLQAFAKERSNGRFLYLVFNKANALEASKRFPHQVKCVTSHSFAWKEGGMGEIYGKKLSERPRPREVAEQFRGQGVSLSRARAAMDVVTQFCSSAATRIEDLRIDMGSAALEQRMTTMRQLGDAPSPGMIRQKRMIEAKEKQLRDARPLAKSLWDSMRDPNGTAQMTHDGYLKLYSLEGKPIAGFDCIMFDEAQDANPATLAILNRAKAPFRVSVGDNYQAIYGFRGNVNALAALSGQPGARTIALTQTWRFGPEIADMANRVLRVCGETTPLIGSGPSGRLVEPRDIINLGREAPGTTAVLTRGNIAAIVLALDTPGLVHFAGGGMERYRGDLIADVFRLCYRENMEDIRNPDVRFSGTYDELKTYAQDVSDVEILSAIEFVEKTGHKTLEALQSIRNREVTDPRKAYSVFSTIHKAKGLEWDHVILGDFKLDANDVYEEASLAIRAGRPLAQDLQQELNLLYVGATRARKTLAPNALLRDLSPVVGVLAAERAAAAAAKGRPPQPSGLRSPEASALAMTPF